MENLTEKTCTAKTWFQQKCANSDTYDLWMKARCLYIFRKKSLSTLYLFERVTTELREQNFPIALQQGFWSSEVHNGIRILFDRIVTRWKPDKLMETIRINPSLHDSLIPERLSHIPKIFGN